MLFQIIHSHTGETCPAKSPEAAKRSGEWWQALKKTSGIKVVVGTVSPLDHTFYITVEADDYQTLTKALWPLLGIGTGDVIPVIPLDQALPLARDLATQTPK